MTLKLIWSLIELASGITLVVFGVLLMVCVVLDKLDEKKRKEIQELLRKSSDVSLRVSVRNDESGTSS